MLHCNTILNHVAVVQTILGPYKQISIGTYCKTHVHQYQYKSAIGHHRQITLANAYITGPDKKTQFI